jgi:hypothetical protein
MVLCVGEGGHIAVERAHASECSPKAAGDSASTSACDDLAPKTFLLKCNPCVDIPLVSSVDLRSNPATVQTVGRAISASAVNTPDLPLFSTGSGQLATASFPDLTPRLAQGGISPLRSAVLLI